MNRETIVFDGNGGGNNNGGWNNGFDWIWAILLFAIFGNGWGGFGGGFGGRGGFALPAELNGDAGRQLLMNAIQGNGTAIGQIATSLGCSMQQVQTALANIQAQSGLSAQQIINAMQSGNMQLLSKISDCCCENRLAICQQTNTLQNSINGVAVGQERGFASIGFETQRQTCDITSAIKDSTAAIIAKQDEAEKTRLLDKIDALRERESSLTTQLNLEHQNNYFTGVVNNAVAPLVAGQQDINARIAKIECGLPPTTVVPNPQVYSMPACVAAQYGFGGYGNGGWGGYGNGGWGGYGNGGWGGYGNGFWF